MYEHLGMAFVSHAGGNQLRYTIELPWEWRNIGACNAANTQFNLSFAVRDDDGQGVKGALEWARCMERVLPGFWGDFLMPIAHANTLMVV
jgi:hypothetical protein